MFIVFCRADSTTAPEGHPFRDRYPDGRVPGRLEQATRQTFSTLEEAIERGKSYSPSRDPFVLSVEGNLGRAVWYSVFYTDAQMRENAERLDFARRTGIDWNK